MAASSQTLDIPALSANFPTPSDFSKDYGWAAIVGVVLLGFGQEPRIKQLGEVLLQQTKDDSKAQITAFRKVREALLKSSPLVGFPRVSRDTIAQIASSLLIRLLSEYQRSRCTQKVLGRFHSQCRQIFGIGQVVAAACAT
jgi:hypothetical protein